MKSYCSKCWLEFEFEITLDNTKHSFYTLYRGSPTSKVSTISTSTNFRAIDIKLVLVEFLPDCYIVKLVLVEIAYVIPTSTNFA